jgi:H2-forming N5,N10-methylenetetrahydromethanopterin dehydrogenase-like enzyme
LYLKKEFCFSIKIVFRSLTNQFSSTRKINTADQVEQVRELTKQMRSSDFRERLNGIEEFQKLCELETDAAVQSLVQIFDGFNECLADMNSKVVLKALNTMHQLVPILGDALSSVINSALPRVAQNIASNNREISQLASDIIDTAIEYIGKRIVAK